MSLSYDDLTALFREELSALDGFAAKREEEGRLLPSSYDPDVRRILEALAFFSARTRAAATASTRAAVRRIAAGTLDDLWAPVPAALLVKATASDQPVTLRAGTQLRVTGTDKVSEADKRIGLFTTELPVTVLPAKIERAAILREGRYPFLEIVLKATGREITSPGWISLYVRQMNDYRASLAIHDALRQSAVAGGASARIDEKDAGPCQVHFGPTPPRQVGDETGRAGLMARVRAFFHMPDRDLFVHVRVPAKPWETLALRIELDEALPADVTVGSGTFHLGVTPASNVWPAYAEPILYDGVRDTYPIRYAGSSIFRDVELLQVRGVYKAGDALTPILPAALSQEGEAYQIEEEGGSPELTLRANDAFVKRVFEKPLKLLVDGTWSQTGLWSSAGGKLLVRLQTQSLPGVSLATFGPMRRPSSGSLARDPSRAFDLLSLRMQPTLERRELSGILEILGADQDGPYRGAHTWIEELNVEEEAEPAGGFRHHYQVALRQKNPDDAPLTRQLFLQIEALLQAWTEQPVHVTSALSVGAPRRLLGIGSS